MLIQACVSLNALPTLRCATNQFVSMCIKRIGRWRVAIAMLLCLILLSCAGTIQPSDERRYELKGTVVSFNKAQQQVVITHETIPELMDAMTMSFTMSSDCPPRYVEYVSWVPFGFRRATKASVRE